MLLAIEPEQALKVHRKALPSQQDAQTPIAEAPTLMGPTPAGAAAVLRRPVGGHRYRPVIRTHPIVLHARRSLMSNRRTKVSDSLSLGSGAAHTRGHATAGATANAKTRADSGHVEA